LVFVPGLCNPAISTNQQQLMMPRLKRTLVQIGLTVAIAFCGQAAFGVEDEDMGFDTTEDLYQVCVVEPGAAEYVPSSFACRGFIEATVQYHDAVSDRKNLRRLICYPENATIADGRATFVAWAKQNAGNQTLMNELPVIGLVRALADKYPCPK
jgi:hypothetical protein